MKPQLPRAVRARILAALERYDWRADPEFVSGLILHVRHQRLKPVKQPERTGTYAMRRDRERAAIIRWVSEHRS